MSKAIVVDGDVSRIVIRVNSEIAKLLPVGYLSSWNMGMVALGQPIIFEYPVDQIELCLQELQNMAELPDVGVETVKKNLEVKSRFFYRVGHILLISHENLTEFVGFSLVDIYRKILAPNQIRNCILYYVNKGEIYQRHALGKFSALMTETNGAFSVTQDSRNMSYKVEVLLVCFMTMFKKEDVDEFFSDVCTVNKLREKANKWRLAEKQS